MNSHWQRCNRPLIVVEDNRYINPYRTDQPTVNIISRHNYWIHQVQSVEFQWQSAQIFQPPITELQIPQMMMMMPQYPGPQYGPTPWYPSQQLYHLNTVDNNENNTYPVENPSRQPQDINRHGTPDENVQEATCSETKTEKSESKEIHSMQQMSTKSGSSHEDSEIDPNLSKVFETSEDNVTNNDKEIFTTPQLNRFKSSASDRSTPRNRISFDKDASSDNENYTRVQSPVKSHYDTTLFLTPEGTPISHSTPDSSVRSRFKRSLADQYSEERSSPNHSRNSSIYYTPDSSPSEYHGFSVKRFREDKTRWSRSRSSNREDSSFSNERYALPSDHQFQPELIGYQLVGDSQFCRYGQQLLGLQRIPMPNSPGRIGICVSGQTITDLHKRVKEKTFPISDKIILMIGTNDFLRNVDVITMCRELTSLIKTLQEDVTQIVLLTLPPIPKLEMKQHKEHFVLLEKYNNHIRSLEDGEKLRIADVSPLYSTPPPYQKCRMHLFELFFNGPQRRQDMIHLNRSGLEVIRKYILDHFI